MNAVHENEPTATASIMTTPAILQTLNAEEFAAMSAYDRMAAIDRLHGSGALMLTSLQKPSGVLMHMIHRIKAQTFILFVDTQFHFKETLEIRDEYIRRYALQITTVYPENTPEQQFEKFGCNLYEYIDGQPNCCYMRKEEPFLKAAREHGVTATISSLMRAEEGARKKIEPIGFDKRLGCKTYYPLYDWTFEQLEDYIREHELPVHKLYAQNYLSIGCAPCTTPVLPGEDRRAGRWRHLRQSDGSKPQYCNINYGDGGGI
ncbi:phosphoadenylyl-sulfate reductase [Candidatus Sumerlaeota bacterium]|nr:phosphoadenylyl-sulfate reductase [Candidatus Sumerlaeota bacterium]